MPPFGSGALSLGAAVLDLTVDKSELRSGLSGARADVEKEVQGLGAKTQALGAALTKTLSVAAAALAVAFGKAFKEWDTGVDALRVGTGATGDELKKLEGSMKRVAGNVTQGMGEVGQVMADLATRTKLTGEPLETLTTQVLNLARITGEDAQASVAGITRLFGDWSIATEDMTPTLDKLFRTSQATGIGVQQLSELMVQFGSPLRNLGLDFETSAAMFAKFEQEGVNIQTVMPGLKMALKNFAAAGREPADALQETFEAMKNAKSESELMSIAFDTFGARAGPDLAAAVREGRFEFADLIDTMNNGTDTIAKATADTTDLSDKMAMWRNRIVAVIGPFGEMGSVVFGVVAAIGPALFGLGVIMQTTTGKMIAGWVANAAAAVTASGTITGAIGTILAGLGSMALAAAPVAIAIGTVWGAWQMVNAIFNQTPWDETLANLAELDVKLAAGTISSEQYAQSVGEMDLSIRDFIKAMEHHAQVLKRVPAMQAAAADEAMRLKMAQAAVASETEEASKTLVNFAGLTKKEFAEWRKSTVDSLNGVKGSLGELANKADLTADDILKSFTKQLDAMRDYEANWSQLLKRGLPDSLAKQLQEMGLEGASVVAALADANHKQFDKIIAKWRAAEASSREIANRVGANIAQGTADGISANAHVVAGAMSAVAQIAIDGANRRLGIESPSKVFYEIGTFIVEGLARGIEDSTVKAERAMTTTVDKIKKIGKKLAGSMKTGFAGFTDVLGVDFGDEGPTAAGIKRHLEMRLAQAREFAAGLKNLTARGLNPRFLQELAAAGPDALPFIKELQGSSLLGDINSIFAEIDDVSRTARSIQSVHGSQPDAPARTFNNTINLQSGATPQEVAAFIQTMELLHG